MHAFVYVSCMCLMCMQHMQGSYVMKPQPPAEIPAADYGVIYKMTQDLNVEKRELLDVFYRRDDNALPAKYVFQVRHLMVFLLLFTGDVMQVQEIMPNHSILLSE